MTQRKHTCEAILFDLDGTLTDSAPGIMNGAQRALQHFGLPEETPESLSRMIGPPLLDSFQNFYGFSPDKAAEAVAIFREYYNRQGLFENSVYPDIPRLLTRLREKGYILCVATSKPEDVTRRILDHFDLTRYFHVICGADAQVFRKGDVIRKTLAAIAAAGYDVSLSQVTMVGDRRQDVEGAKACGISCIGALYGYGTREELGVAGATAIAETVAQIEDLV